MSLDAPLNGAPVEVLAPGTALVRLTETAALEQATDPAGFATERLALARLALDQATSAGDIEFLLGLKGEAEMIRVWSVQREMGKGLELDAAEFVRRTERAIGVAIRAGQERGEIGSRAKPTGCGPRADYERDGKTVHVSRDPVGDTTTISPAALLPNAEERMDAYVFADEATNEEFEEVLAEAKAEGNLSRANVKRKVQRKDPPPAKRPAHLRGTHHIDPNRVVRETVLAALVDDTTFELLEGRYSELDRDLIEGWVCSLSEAINALSRLKRNLKKDQTQ